jgi:iron complex transport system substrate-binding protein
MLFSIIRFCKRLRVLSLLTVLGAVLLTMACEKRMHREGGYSAQLPTRIVSLAPSITETLFALGLGERLVGVTSYCTFPPAVASIPKVGGYTDANLETLLMLRPQLVLLQSEHEKQQAFLTRHNIPWLAVNYRTIAHTCSSFATIGRACGAVAQADSLIALFTQKMAKHDTVSHRPRVLVCVGREGAGGGAVQSVFVAGSATFYNDLLEAAGAANAFTPLKPDYPRLSREGIIAMAPDIIIDIASAMGEYACDSLLADWHSLSMVPAVRQGRLYCLAQDYATVPGPRVVQLLDDLRKIIAHSP